VFNEDIELAEYGCQEEDKGEEAEVDDSLSIFKYGGIIAVSTVKRGTVDLSLSEEAKKRRKWVVTPLRTVNTKTGT
jgi:hypothetical protein